MREILFRGKRKDNGEWVYGSPIFQDNYVLIRFWNSEEFKYEEYLVFPESISEFTGLYDCTKWEELTEKEQTEWLERHTADEWNGKKIFEGDIVRYADFYDYNCYLESLDNIESYDNIDFGDIWTIDEVVYCAKIGYPAFDLNKHDFEINGLSELNESGQYYYEVIGNIHDNPELVRGE